MSITESLSTFPEIYNEHYTLIHAKHLFSRMRDRCPKEYEEKIISIRKAAELLNVDPKTLHQRIGMLKPKAEITNGYTKKLLVSLRDLADMLIEKPFRKCVYIPKILWSKQDIDSLVYTGKCKGRTYAACKTKKVRLRKIRIKI
jgi:hypothetical protein